MTQSFSQEDLTKVVLIFKRIISLHKIYGEDYHKSRVDIFNTTPIYDKNLTSINAGRILLNFHHQNNETEFNFFLIKELYRSSFSYLDTTINPRISHKMRIDKDFIDNFEEDIGNGLEYMILKHGKIITKFFYFIILIEEILDNFYLKYDKILNS